MKKILLILCTVLSCLEALSQDNNGFISGYTINPKNKPISNVTIKATHVPTQTTYTTNSKEGSFKINNVLLGGPYQIHISKDSFISQSFEIDDINVGQTIQLNIFLKWDSAILKAILKVDSIKKWGVPKITDTTRVHKTDSTESNLEDSILTNIVPPAVTDTPKSEPIDVKSILKSLFKKTTVLDTVTVLNKDTSFIIKQSPFGTLINKSTLKNFPTLNRSLNDFINLNPYANQNLSILGLDNRLNNITIDGTSFNNKFGLYPLPGGQTSSNILSIDAIENISVNATPYNLKYSGFTGGSINIITKSGTNKLHGTGFVNYRGASLAGKLGGIDGQQNTDFTNFNNVQFGATVSGPIKLNKIFYLVNFEGLFNQTPANSFRPGTDANSTKIVLDSISNYLNARYNYQTGSYTNYNLINQAFNFIFKLDWNLSQDHKLSIKLNALNSFKDFPNSNIYQSSTLLSFQNSNYRAFSNNYGLVAQLNSKFKYDIKNEIVLGVNYDQNYRTNNGTDFPSVTILNGFNQQALISFGPDGYSLTNRNQTNTLNFQLTDNVYYNYKRHFLNLGLQVDYTSLQNTFNPNVLGNYTYSNFDSFKSPTALPIGYSYNYSNTNDRSNWVSNNSLLQIGVYLQDEFVIDPNLKIQFGIRFDIPILLNQFPANAVYNNSTTDFYNADGFINKVASGLPPSSLLQWSPRISYTYDVLGKHQTFLRGGVGLFNGVNPLLYFSTAQTGNGLIYGSENNNGYSIANRQFNTTFPQPWTPPVVTGNNTLPNYNLFLISPDYKYPQVFRANFEVQHQFKNIQFTSEVLFSQNLSANVFYNSNQKPAISNFNGPDKRPIYGLINKNPYQAINSNETNVSYIRANTDISEAIILTSAPLGGVFNFKIQLEKPFIAKNRFAWFAAYNFLSAKDYASLQANYTSGWNGILSVNGNNKPGLGISDYENPHRLLGYISYKQPIIKDLHILFTLFAENKFGGRYNYVYAGDQNGDGIYGNDLLYVPKDQGEMNFADYSMNGVTITKQDQNEAFENYINQDPYLKTRRGRYIERNGGIVPQVFRFDLSTKLIYSLKNTHSVEFRFDIFNINNLLNAAWGTNNYLNNPYLLTFLGINPQGEPVYNFNAFNGSINYSSFSKGANLADVWQIQLGVRYHF